MKKSETYGGNFLKAENLIDGKLPNGKPKYNTLTLTICKIESHTFDDGKGQRVLSFENFDKKLGLNVTNWNRIEAITGKDDDDQWIGETIEVFVDPYVEFQGKIIPAIRVREPSGKVPHPSAPPAPPAVGMSKAEAWAAMKARYSDAETCKGVWFKAIAACLPPGVTQETAPPSVWAAVATWTEPAPVGTSPVHAPIPADDIPF